MMFVFVTLQASRYITTTTAVSAGLAVARNSSIVLEKHLNSVANADYLPCHRHAMIDIKKGAQFCGSCVNST